MAGGTLHLLEAQAEAAQVLPALPVRDSTAVAEQVVVARLVAAVAAQAALVVAAMAPPVQGRPLTLKAPRFFTPEAVVVVVTLLIKTLRDPGETETLVAGLRPEETAPCLSSFRYRRRDGALLCPHNR